MVAGGAPVQQIAQGQQSRSLARLSRGVQHEVLLAPHQSQHVVEIDPRERRDAVVVPRADRTLRVEEAHRLHCGNPVATVVSPPAGAGAARTTNVTTRSTAD